MRPSAMSAADSRMALLKMKKGVLRKAQAKVAEKKQLMRRAAKQNEIDAMLNSSDEDDEDDDDDDKESQSDCEDTTDIQRKTKKTASSDEDEEKENEDEDETTLHVYTEPEQAGGAVNPPEKRGVVYLGRIPHGFYEPQMRAYFSQFGTVTRLRLSRNKKTGHSRHYGFVEFDDPEVAAIVAETMDGYLMFNHVMRCNVVPNSELHPDTFKGCDAPTRNGRSRVSGRRGPRSAPNQIEPELALRRLAQSEQRRKKALARLGISYEPPAPIAAVPEAPVQSSST